MQLTILGFWILFLILVIGVILTVRWYNFNLQPVDRQQTPKQRFEVVRGASLDEITNNLKQRGLIKDETAFKWHLRLNGLDNKLQAGVFELSPSYYGSQIAEILSSATLASLDIIIYPEQRLDQIEDSLVKQGFERLNVQMVMQLDNYRDHPVLTFIPAEGDLEGYIAPETFSVDQFNADSARNVIGRALDTFADNMTDEIQAGILENFQSVHEGVILASIVEAEVGPEDRDKAAQVFIKRLSENQKLESDATFLYAAAVEGGPIAVDHPSLYNTRLHFGLPPGPIGNISASSLRAVAFPADTNYLYFVSGDDGTNYFNETYEGHLRDSNKYCIEKCKLPSQ